MLNGLQQFYLNLDEPSKGCLLFLRNYLLKFNTGITEEWKYRLPFFYLNGKMFCYFWFESSKERPYLGFMNGNLMKHSKLESGNRKRVKIYSIDPSIDLDLAEIDELLLEAIDMAKH